jgi:hypothetical protein
MVMMKLRHKGHLRLSLFPIATIYALLLHWFWFQTDEGLFAVSFSQNPPQNLRPLARHSLSFPSILFPASHLFLVDTSAAFPSFLSLSIGYMVASTAIAFVRAKFGRFPISSLYLFLTLFVPIINSLDRYS